MKTLPKIIAMTLLMLAGVTLQAQEYTISASSGTLHLGQIRSVTLKGTDSNNVTITRSGKNSDQPERAKGLKLINPGGFDDNTGLGLNVTQEGDTWTVREVSNRSGDRYEIQIPNAMMVHYEYNGMNAGKLKIDNVKSELDVSVSYNSVELTGVTGPMAINTVYGSIEADFAQVSQTGSISLYSVYSHVDVKIPEQAKANFKLATEWGEAYSNLDLEYATSEDGMRNLTQGKYIATLNGGGVDFQVKSSYGNVYLRSK